MKRVIIGFTGRVYTGKTAAANFLADFASTDPDLFVYHEVMPFAGPLKDMARIMGWNGVKDEKGRKLMQLLGTECMRKCIDPDGWVKLWRKKVDEFFLEADSATDPEIDMKKDKIALVIADDVRFDNEAAEINALGGKVFKVFATTSCREARAEALGEQLPERHVSEEGINEQLLSGFLPNGEDLQKLANLVYAEVFRPNFKQL